MPRPIPQHGEPVNGDSFLDIVASVVSIMIIMVVMVGMRIKNAPVTVAIPANPAMKELEKDAATEKSLRADVFKLAEETRQLQQEAARRCMQRDVLATMVTAVEQKIQERRQNLDAAKRADFDLARGLSEAKFQLDQLHRQREQAAEAPARAGGGRKLSHADQPRGGRPRGASADFQRPRAVRAVGGAAGGVQVAGETAGPQAARPAGANRHGRAGRRFSPSLHPRAPRRFARGNANDRPRRQLRGAAALVAAARLERPWRAGAIGLDQGSDFRQKLAKILPGRTTITIWVYPDGFDAFREIRKELYRQNYTIAARPLPMGEPIAGSPNGSKSAAQ